MVYKPTGRAPGRPRGPVTADGKLTQARKLLPHVRAFPELRRAVDRVMAVPDEVVVRLQAADLRDVDVEHRYTPAERGQALAFVWWVYSNRSTWPRTKLRAAIASISPMMLFPSSFLAEITGLPQSTVTKNMIRPPGMSVTRVTGSCNPWVIHRLLEATLQDLPEYRQTVREMALMRDAPKAMMARLSGVPSPVLLRPERGVQFFPEAADYLSGRVCSQQQYLLHPGGKERYGPRLGDQSGVRDAFAGTCMAELVTTSVPIPEEGINPYFTSIPGLPAVRDIEKLGPKFYERLREWEFRYHLPAKIFESRGNGR